MSGSAPDSQVTRLLNRMSGGDRAAETELAPILYAELKRLAGRFMQDERTAHTLQPTALVHEAWLRLVDPRDGEWANRAQYFRMASRVMRAVLVDHARARRTAKRGGDREREPLDPEACGAEDLSDYYLSLDEALQQLGERDPDLAEVAELHLFGGLELKEVAGVLERSTRRVERGWRTARAWLRGTLGDDFAVGAS